MKIRQVTCRCEEKHGRVIWQIQTLINAAAKQCEEKHGRVICRQEKKAERMESMPEYRRFIAYFYEYIDGKKAGNAGFAKVELRSGMWRILFRLTVAHSPEPPVQVYGFVREKGYLLGLLMGTMRSGNQMLEEWAYHAGNPIWHRKYGFSDLAGIWIQCGDGNRYVTVWDDDPIEINRFVLELPEEIDENPEEEAVRNEHVREAQNARKEAAAAGTVPVSYGKDITEMQERQIEAAQLEEDGIYTKLARRSEEDAARMQEDENSPEKEMKKEMKKEEELEAHATSDSAAVALWDTIMHRRQPFEPFEDTQFGSCFKIQPCDLVMLQRAGYQVGRSSFLLHGFYQYHHLLLCRQEDGSFVLGIPGLQNPQERYMAQTFGFPDFKTAKWMDHGRQFGYWYRTIGTDTDEKIRHQEIPSMVSAVFPKA